MLFLARVSLSISTLNLVKLLMGHVSFIRVIPKLALRLKLLVLLVKKRRRSRMKRLLLLRRLLELGPSFLVFLLGVRPRTLSVKLILITNLGVRSGRLPARFIFLILLIKRSQRLRSISTLTILVLFMLLVVNSRTLRAVGRIPSIGRLSMLLSRGNRRRSLIFIFIRVALRARKMVPTKALLLKSVSMGRIGLSLASRRRRTIVGMPKFIKGPLYLYQGDC